MTPEQQQWQALLGMDIEAPFWLVWNPQGHAPTFKHHSAESAKNEAERLARLNPRQIFHVLEAKAACQHESVRWTPVNNDWVPF